MVKINKELVNRPVEPPPRHKLQKFFKSVLCDFNSFEALNRFFRQTQGCFMGSKLSPSLANIFCSLFETAIIEPDLENKKLLGYVRYVDDILLIVKRDYKDRLLGKLNAFDPFLKFTTESMVDSKINFLDTTVTLNNRQINLEMYRKPTFTDKTVDFKNSISPKNYKWSTFIGEIFRCNNCTSDINSRDRAIENTKQIFLKNNFPSHIMDQKIAEVKNRDFRPSENKLRREEDRKNPDLVFHTMSVLFTFFRC